MKNSKFNPLFETIYSRFQNGAGFLAGDVVKLKSNYKNLECYKALGENVKQRIEDITKTGNNIRVGRLHNSHFSNSYGAMGGTDAPATLADCYEEVAPSFWRNLVTIPVECLETANPLVDLPPVPANQKDKQRAYQKPLEASKDKPNKGTEIDEQTKVGKKQTHAPKGDYELATKNTKLDNSNNYDDSKPSKPKGMEKAKELKESYENIYGKMLTEDIGAMGGGANYEEVGYEEVEGDLDSEVDQTDTEDLAGMEDPTGMDGSSEELTNKVALASKLSRQAMGLDSQLASEEDMDNSEEALVKEIPAKPDNANNPFQNWPPWATAETEPEQSGS